MFSRLRRLFSRELSVDARLFRTDQDNYERCQIYSYSMSMEHSQRGLVASVVRYYGVAPYAEVRVYENSNEFFDLSIDASEQRITGELMRLEFESSLRQGREEEEEEEDPPPCYSQVQGDPPSYADAVRHPPSYDSLKDAGQKNPPQKDEGSCQFQGQGKPERLIQSVEQGAFLG